MTAEIESRPFVVYMTLREENASLRLQSIIQDEWANAAIHLFEDDNALLSALKSNVGTTPNVVVLSDQVAGFL